MKLLQPTMDLVSQVFTHRRIVLVLALQQLQDRFTGTVGGLFWAVLHPLVLLSVFWVVFALGFKIQEPTGIPFVLTLFCGLIPWMTFNEALSGSVNSVTSRAYMVKKIAFPTEILPVTCLVSSLITHGILLLMLYAMLGWYDRWPGLTSLFFLYYLFAMCFFIAGFSWLLAGLNVFHRDIGQGLSMFLNIWFWGTPIVWSLGMLPAGFRPYVELNPLTYVVEGYRGVFLSPLPLSINFGETAYFWILSSCLFLLGSSIFRWLKPNFADVL